MDIKLSLALANKAISIYEERCKPLCRQAQITQTAFDILMYLANHPQSNTARDIVEIRGIKANLVSVNVDKLVKEGFIERQPDTVDRRKIHLTCTDKAQPIIEAGHKTQRSFLSELTRGINNKSLEEVYKVLEIIHRNIYDMN